MKSLSKINILFFGDIYGRVGRKLMKENVKRMRKDLKIDLVVANGENATNGKSISFSHYNELRDSGIDIITSGNHIFAHPEVLTYIDEVDNKLLRPENMGYYIPGSGTVVLKVNNHNIRITNLIGRVFMNPNNNNPYQTLEKILEEDAKLKNKDKIDVHLVDFHAEATAEKKALAWFFDGKISAILGTHTHVQTNDEEIMPKGTAFITDVGMNGPFYSIIGADPINVIIRSRNNIPVRLVPAYGEGIISAVLINFEQNLSSTTIYKYKAVKIKKILIKPTKK